MKTVVLIRNAETVDFRDEEILSAVERAGTSTLLVDRKVRLRESPSSPINIVHADLRSFGTRGRSVATIAKWDRSYRVANAVWVLDTRGLNSRDISKGLRHLQSQIFCLPGPPRALVLESDRETHIGVLEELRNAYGFAHRRNKYLNRAANQAWWSALLLRVLGLRGAGLTKRFAKAFARFS